MEDIANKIKQARLEKGLSQEDLASKLFITKQSVSKYENNRSVPSKEILEKLEEILEITLSEEVLVVQNNRTNALPIIVTSSFALIFLVVGVFTFVKLMSVQEELSLLGISYDQAISNKEQSNLNYENILLDYNQLSGSYDNLDDSFENLGDAYDSIYLEHQDLLDLYDDLTKDYTLEYTDFIVAYNNSYTLSGTLFSASVTVHTSADGGVIVKSADFSLTVRMNDGSDDVDVNFDQSIFQVLQTNSSYTFTLSENFEDVPSNTAETIELYYKGELVAIIDVED